MVMFLKLPGEVSFMAPDCNSQSLLFTGKSFMKIFKIPKSKKGNAIKSQSGRCALQQISDGFRRVHVEISTSHN